MDNQQLNTYIMNRKPKRGFGFIYKYTSPSGKSYVGQTIQTLSERAKYSGKGYRKCSVFYKAILKYGFENFKCEILDEVPVEELNSAESYWISFSDTLCPKGYNILSDSNPVTVHKIYQYNKTTGEFIQEFNSIKEATNYLQLNSPTRISACLNGRAKTGNGYIWRKEKVDSVEPYLGGQDCTPKEVFQYSLAGDFVCKYKSIGDAAEATKTQRSQIRKVANKEQSQAGGYIWSFEYKDKLPPVKTTRHGGKPVRQVNPDTNEVIAIFDSQSAAARAVGVNTSTIQRAVKNGSKCANFKWMYV